VKQTLLRFLAAAIVVLGLLPGAGESAARLRVVATIPDLKALAEAVGGDLVDVDALARGTQNAHELEIRPSLMLKVRKADVLIENGLDLDTWVDVVVQGANNPNVVAAPPASSTPRAASRCWTFPPVASTAPWATSTRSATRTTRSTRGWRPL
jgi:ABC-type Zn uptake system ZnuABC Zn-binding protein ZnuA